jgi:hypothetical protein
VDVLLDSLTDVFIRCHDLAAISPKVTGTVYVAQAILKTRTSSPRARRIEPE